MMIITMTTIGMLTSMHQFINSRELPSHLPLPSLASLSLDHNKCKSFSAAVIIINILTVIINIFLIIIIMHFKIKTRLRRIPPNLLDNTTNLLDLLLHSNR